MKDGKKAKSKKAPGKKSGKAAVAAKAAHAEARPKGGAKKAVKKVSAPAPGHASSKGSPGAPKAVSGKGATGKAAVSKAAAPRAVSERPGEVQFSNPAVAAAFKRAVKKYPAALKRLTD